MFETLLVIGITLVVMLGWRLFHRDRRGRETDELSLAVKRENDELRHVVTEMAMEKHHSDEARRRH